MEFMHLAAVNSCKWYVEHEICMKAAVNEFQTLDSLPFLKPEVVGKVSLRTTALISL